MWKSMTTVALAVVLVLGASSGASASPGHRGPDPRSSG